MLVAKKSQPTERLFAVSRLQAQASTQLDATCSYGSTHLAAFLTLQVSTPFFEIFLQSVVPVRAQVEFASARLTSLRHAVGKPTLPSAFTRALSTAPKHFAYALDF